MGDGIRRHGSGSHRWSLLFRRWGLLDPKSCTTQRMIFATDLPFLVTKPCLP